MKDWHILNEETNKNIYFSVHRPQGLLRVRTNCQQHYRTPSRHWLSLWRPGLYWFVSSFLWERSIQKHNQRKIIYILNAVSSWLLGVNVSNFILFGVIITRPLSTKWFKYFILLNSDSFHFSTITDISHIMKQARWELVGGGLPCLTASAAMVRFARFTWLQTRCHFSINITLREFRTWLNI